MRKEFIQRPLYQFFMLFNVPFSCAPAFTKQKRSAMLKDKRSEGRMVKLDIPAKRELPIKEVTLTSCLSLEKTIQNPEKTEAEIDENEKKLLNLIAEIIVEIILNETKDECDRIRKDQC